MLYTIVKRLGESLRIQKTGIKNFHFDSLKWTFKNRGGFQESALVLVINGNNEFYDGPNILCDIAINLNLYLKGNGIANLKMIDGHSKPMTNMNAFTLEYPLKETETILLQTSFLIA